MEVPRKENTTPAVLRWEIADLAANVFDAARQSLRVVAVVPLGDPRLGTVKAAAALLVEAATLMGRAPE